MFETNLVLNMNDYFRCEIDNGFLKSNRKLQSNRSDNLVQVK